ncbi:hypothetical protein FOCC_FOCC011653, partial [Frankliniella occidentalis]
MAGAADRESVGRRLLPPVPQRLLAVLLPGGHRPGRRRVHAAPAGLQPAHRPAARARRRGLPRAAALRRAGVLGPRHGALLPRHLQRAPLHLGRHA